MAARGARWSFITKEHAHIRLGRPTCQAKDGESWDARYGQIWGRRIGLAALFVSMGLVSGCGGGGGSTGFSSERLPDAGPSIKLPSLSGSGSQADRTGAPQVALADGRANSCPQIVAWPNEKLKTVYQNGHEGDANFIIYRGEITKLSRECRVYGGRVVVKYGYAGRLSCSGRRGIPGAFLACFGQGDGRLQGASCTGSHVCARNRSWQPNGRLLLNGARDFFACADRNTPPTTTKFS